jgi:predicted transcriptional regulator
MATIRQMRRNAGLTAEDLAHLAGVSLSTITRIERGSPPVTRLTAGKVVRALSEYVKRDITIEDVEGLQIKEEPEEAVA